VVTDGKLAWHFFADQCRHCLEPPCKDAIEGYVSGAVIHDEATGAVVYNEKSKEAPFDEVKDSCPYDIPRKAADGRIVKCTMCIDRVSNGLIPACVKICPTGAMNFGELDDMLAMAEQRVEKLKGKYPKVRLIDEGELRVIFLVVDDPRNYHKNAIAGANPGIIKRFVQCRLLKPAQNVSGTVGQV
jgi:formate dehydrogenase iron-sulfur subunit